MPPLPSSRPFIGTRILVASIGISGTLDFVEFWGDAHASGVSGIASSLEQQGCDAVAGTWPGGGRPWVEGILRRRGRSR